MVFSREKILSSFKWNSLTVIVVAVLVFIQTYILLRFLSKEDFGIMAIINASFLFLRSFNTISITSSLLYFDKIEENRNKLSSVFWMLFLLNGLLMIGMFFSSEWLGQTYDSKEISFGLKVFSCIFLFDFVTAIYRTLLQKRMEFKKLFNVFVVAKLISFSCAVILAMKGFGYKSLLYSVLVYAVLEMMICSGYGLKSFVPNLNFKFADLKGVLTFGAYETGAKLVGETRKQLDVFLIGNILGLELLGVYNVLKTLLIKIYKFVNPLLSTVTMPWMSNEKADLDLNRKIFFGQNKVLTLIIAPIYITLFVFAPFVVEQYFGIEYKGFTVVFQILTIAYFIGNPISLSGSLFVAHGKVREVFYWNIACLLVYVTAIYFLYPHGLIGFSLALVVFFTFMIISFNSYIIQGTLNTGWKAYYKSYFAELGIGILLGAVYYFLIKNLSLLPLVSLLIMLSYFVLFYLLYLWINKKILKNQEVNEIVGELWQA